MFLSAICAFSYWLFYQYYHVYHTRPISKYEGAFIKWLSVVLLMDFLNAHVSMSVLLFYSIGDIVILWNESISIIFFLIGHLIFISQHIPFHDLIPMCTALALASIFFSVYMYEHHYVRSKRVCIKTAILYFLYMLILAYLLVSSLHNYYYGFIFFVISDIGIGFDIEWLYLLEFPLYYISLLYFIWHF